MTNSAKKYIDSYSDFSANSLEFCRSESSKLSEKVSQIIDFIAKDSDRVSKMHQGTLDALSQMKELIGNLSAENRDTEKANKLSLALSSLSNENIQAQELIFPILEALQFQDRISQNMDNLTKMVAKYFEYRNSVTQDGHCVSSLSDFGEDLLKITVMAEEREIIRKYIDGLSDGEAKDDVMFF